MPLHASLLTIEKAVPSKKKWGYDDRMLQRLSDEMASVRDIMAYMMSLTADTNLPIGFRRVLRDTFKCQICHTVLVKLPVIVKKCCWGAKNVLRSRGHDEDLSNCNETVVLHGLTIKALKPLEELCNVKDWKLGSKRIIQNYCKV